ncbi:hypothetical protein BZA77DRAFT_5108 [Pyronema omphalodes]|nr:hypothetical protein BZA77DRAFT_5108 [Pyronema omphalodes]
MFDTVRSYHPGVVSPLSLWLVELVAVHHAIAIPPTHRRSSTDKGSPNRGRASSQIIYSARQIDNRTFTYVGHMLCVYKTRGHCSSVRSLNTVPPPTCLGPLASFHGKGRGNFRQTRRETARLERNPSKTQRADRVAEAKPISGRPITETPKQKKTLSFF